MNRTKYFFQCVAGVLAIMLGLYMFIGVLLQISQIPTYNLIDYVMTGCYALWVFLLLIPGIALVKKPVKNDKIVSKNFHAVVLFIVSFVIFIQAFMVLTNVFPRHTITEIAELSASVVIMALLITYFNLTHPAVELKDKKKELARKEKREQKQKKENIQDTQTTEISEEDELLNIEIDKQLSAFTMNGLLSSEEELDQQVENELKNLNNEISENTQTTDERIERLKKLREENLLTEEEFKKLLLDELKK